MATVTIPDILIEDAQFKRLNQCEDLVALNLTRYNSTDIIITVLEHKVDITNGYSVPETEVLLEDYHNNLKPLY